MQLLTFGGVIYLYLSLLRSRKNFYRKLKDLKNSTGKKD